MSWWAVLALTLAAGLAPPAAASTPRSAAAARATTTSPPVEASTRASRRTTKRKQAKRRALAAKQRRKQRKPKQVSRIPTRSSLRNVKNMPRGYRWPPSRQMRAAGAACTAQLDAAGVPWKPTPPEGRIVSPITVADAEGALRLGGITYTSAYRKPPHKLDCQLALALEQFGQAMYVLGVREIKFGSIYRWTNVRVRGKTKNMLSRHALGIAMDINSFTDWSGREAVVKDAYPADDPLLLAVEDAINASGRFRVVLTPRNDPVSHRDHFHVEVAVDYTDTPP